MKNSVLGYFSFYFTFNIFLSVILMLIVFSSFTEVDFQFFISSDTLYLSSIYEDIFVDGNSITDWQLNPAPNLFPDMFLYFVLRFFVGSTLLSSFVFPIIQLIIILLLLRSVLFFFLSKKIVNQIIITGAIILNLLIVHAIFENHLWLTFQIISNSYHLGAFINTLLALLFVLKYLQNKRLVYLFLYCIVVFVGVFSDKLFLLQFVIPFFICFSLLIKKNKAILKTKIIVLVLTVFLSLFAIILFNSITVLTFGTNGSKAFNFEDVIFSFHNQIKHVFDIGKSNWVGSLIVLLSLFSNFTFIFIVAKGLIFNQKSNYFWVALFVIIYNGISFSVPFLAGMYMGHDCIRYNFNFYIVSLFLFPLALVFLDFSKKILAVSNVIFLGIFVTIVFINGSRIKNFDTYIDYYPLETQNLDFLKEKYNLKNGIGDYWNAKRNRILSKKGLKIYSVFNNLNKYEHVTNKSLFYSGDAVFNFVLFNIKEQKGEEEQEKWILHYFPNAEKIEYKGTIIYKTKEFTYSNSNYELVKLNNN